MAMSRSRGAFQVTVSPPMRMSPAVTSSRPAIIRSVVVFPHPDGPTRMQNSRSRTVRSMPATTSVSPNRLTTLSRTTSAIGSDGPQLLLGVVHRGADRLPLRHFGEHRRDDELRVHGGRGLRHRARVADEDDVVLEVLQQLQLRLVAEHRHRLLGERLQERVVVPGALLHAAVAVRYHGVEELARQVLVLREVEDAIRHGPGAVLAALRPERSLRHL